MLELNTVKYLNEFIILAKTGNYNTACDMLYLSKSTLTKHIKDLEISVEHKLFIQSGHKLVLTDFGKFFLDYATRFTVLDKEYASAKARYDEICSSQVLVAVSSHMNCDHMVNMLWDHFILKHPDYHLSTIEYQAAYLSREDLSAMGYELIFGLSALPYDTEYCCFTWAESQIIAVLPKSHPLAKRESIKLTELSSESFILTPSETALYKMAVDLCRQAGFEPKINFTIQGSANLIELVSGNVGVSLSTANDVPASLYSDRASLVPLEPATPVYLNLYYRKDQSLSVPASTFLNYAKMIHTSHSMDIPYYGPEAGVENAFFE